MKPTVIYSPNAYFFFDGVDDDPPYDPAATMDNYIQVAYDALVKAYPQATVTVEWLPQNDLSNSVYEYRTGGDDEAAWRTVQEEVENIQQIMADVWERGSFWADGGSVEIDPENLVARLRASRGGCNDEKWWAAANAARDAGTAPALFVDLMRQHGDDPRLLADTASVRAVEQWATSLPGWNDPTAPDYARHPLIIRYTTDEEG